MATPLIAYLSMLRESTASISDPGTESGFDIDDIHNLKSYAGWKSDTTVKPINIDIDMGSDSETADYIAIVNSNLSTISATVQVLSSNQATGAPGATEQLAATAVTDDNVWYQPFTVGDTHRYFRIAITTGAGAFSAAPATGEIFLGMKTSLNSFLTPDFPPFFKGVEAIGTRSEGGHYLGAILRGQTHRATISFGEAGAARADFTSDLNAFLDDHALLRKPFVFIVDPDDSDFDTARYIRMADGADAARLAVAGKWARLRFDLEVVEAMMEAA